MLSLVDVFDMSQLKYPSQMYVYNNHHFVATLFCVAVRWTFNVCLSTLLSTCVWNHRLLEVYDGTKYYRQFINNSAF